MRNRFFYEYESILRLNTLSFQDIYLRIEYNLLLDHTNYVFCKDLKIYNRNMLTHPS